MRLREAKGGRKHYKVTRKGTMSTNTHKENKKLSKQVRLEDYLHRELKTFASSHGMTITALLSRYVRKNLQEDGHVFMEAK
jgi:predicted DNA-binding ribbon-helix-helix protein